jgi:lysophospholipid acyltransferase (LPLAT)-like uncharacterized protein
VLRGDFDTQQVIALWHENIYLSLLASSFLQGVAVYVWKHRMAEFSARLIRSFGLHVIEGGPDNLYGQRAVKAWLRGGPARKLVVAVDGPLGPRRVVKRGALHFAAVAGIPLRGALFSATSSHRLPTWDGRTVPEPGLRLIMSNTSPIDLEQSDAVSRLQRHLDCESMDAKPRHTASVLAWRCWARACIGPYYWGRITGPVSQHSMTSAHFSQSQVFASTKTGPRNRPRAGTAISLPPSASGP